MKNSRGEKIEFKYNIKGYWEILKKHKKLFFSLLFVSLIVEALFTVDKLLFKKIIDDGTNFIEGILPKEIFVKTLVVILIIFVAVTVTKVIGKWITIHLVNLLDSRLIQEIKLKYFNHLLKLSHNFHTTHKTGSLISRMNRGSGAIETMTDVLIFNVAPLFFQLAIVGASLAYFNSISALVILAIAVVFISYSFFIQNIQQNSRLKFNDSQDAEKGFISDIFTNVDSIKYYGKEEDVEKKFDKITAKTKSRGLKNWGYYRWFDAGEVLILAIGTFFLIYFPLISFLNKEITLGTLVFIYTIYGNVVGPMFGFVGGVRNFYRSMADFQDLFEYGKIENDIKDKPGAKNLTIEEGAVEFRNVSFKYGSRKIFSDFNLKIKSNEKVALVGHSGSGKTTLIKLFKRFYDVDGGGDINRWERHQEF